MMAGLNECWTVMLNWLVYPPLFKPFLSTYNLTRVHRPVDFPAWCEVRVEPVTCKVFLVQTADPRRLCSPDENRVDPSHGSLNLQQHLDKWRLKAMTPPAESACPLKQCWVIKVILAFQNIKLATLVTKTFMLTNSAFQYFWAYTYWPFWNELISLRWSLWHCYPCITLYPLRKIYDIWYMINSLTGPIMIYCILLSMQ